MNTKPDREEPLDQLETHRIQNETIDEWYQDYDAKFSDDPNYVPPPLREVVEIKKDVFVFESFRTTRLGRLAMSFINIRNGVVVDTFFNVDIKKQRSKGEYKIGANAQFLPKPKSNFRTFWLQSVKKEPRRWSTVHKEIRPRLKGLLFEGETKDSYRSDGSPYIQLINLQYLGTRKEQDGNKVGTEWEQGF